MFCLRWSSLRQDGDGSPSYLRWSSLAGFQLLPASNIFYRGILVTLQYLFHWDTRGSFFLAIFNS